jgi:hypothetical protein
MPALLAPFGIAISERDTYSVDVPECVYPAGRALAASLLEQTDLALRQVGWAFGWLFSCTGNSLIDYTDEALSEIPPLSWSAEDVAFAIELIEEADGILRDVQAGIDHLKQSPDLRAALERNVRTLYTLLARHNSHRDKTNVTLSWNSLTSSLSPEPECGTAAQSDCP